jgi:HAD superfamily hydrolase (TIGR01549 family)
MNQNGKSTPGSISTVIFDFDGTIRYSDPRGADVFHQYVAESGFSFSEDQRKSAERWLHYYWAQSSELAEDIERFGDSQNGDFWRQHARRHVLLLGVAEDEVENLSEEVTEKMRSGYNSVDCIPEDVPTTLEALKANGYKLAVVSNRHENFSDILEKYEILAHFDFVLAAGEVGWWKPDPRLLQHAVEKLGVAPTSSIYVGDNYYADVLGARAANLKPVLIDPFSLYSSPDCPVIIKISDLLSFMENGNSK